MKTKSTTVNILPFTIVDLIFIRRLNFQLICFYLRCMVAFAYSINRTFIVVREFVSLLMMKVQIHVKEDKSIRAKYIYLQFIFIFIFKLFHFRLSCKIFFSNKN